MLDFVRISRLCVYELRTAMKLLTANLSEEQMTLARKYNAIVAGGPVSAPHEQ